MHVYYLNLRRREDRNAHFLRANAEVVDVKRVDAIDGQCLRVEDLMRQGVIQEPLRAYTPGALGNALSHKKVWELCAAEAAVVTVAEDDAVLNRRFPEKAERLLASLPPDWDIVLWGWNFDAPLYVGIIEGVKKSMMRFDGGNLGPRVVEFQEKEYGVVPLRLITAFGVVCYSISPNGARQLLQRCFPLRSEKISVAGMRWKLANATIDTVMNKHYGAMKSYVCFPPLVWTENDKIASDVHPKGWSLARMASLLCGMIARR